MVSALLVPLYALTICTFSIGIDGRFSDSRQINMARSGRLIYWILVRRKLKRGSMDTYRHWLFEAQLWRGDVIASLGLSAGHVESFAESVVSIGRKTGP